MSIRNTEKWSVAEHRFSQLHMKPTFSLFGFSLDFSLGEAVSDTDTNLAEILEDCPEFFPAWFQKAELKFRTGNDKEGEEYFEAGFRQFCEIVTDQEEFCNLLFNWVETLVTLLRFDLTASILERAIELFPNESSFHDELAYCLIQTSSSDEQFDKAVKHQKLALDEEPDNDYYISNLGWLYFVSGNYEKAEELFQTAVEYNSENETAFENLEMTEYIRENNLDFSGYLLRPVEDNQMSVLLEHGDVEEAREIATGYNEDRVQAFKIHYLKQKDFTPHELLGILRVMETMIEVFEALLPDDVVMVEEVDIIHANLKDVLAHLLDEAEFMDSGTLEFFGRSLGHFYDFLISHQLCEADAVTSFRKDLDSYVQALASNLEEYYLVLRDVTLNDKERREKIENLFSTT